MFQKNLLLAIVTLVLFSVSISNLNAQLLNLTVKAGYNLSDVSGNYPVETNNKSGFSFYVEKDIINLLVVTLSGEAGYIQKGFDEEVIITNKFGVETGRGDIHYKLGYIDLSVLGKLRVPGGIVYPYILAGPTLGFKVSSGVSSSLSELNEFVAGQEQFVSDFKSTSFGIKVGLGIEVSLPLISILAEGRYNPDLTSSYDKNNIQLKNRVYEFLLGVKF